MASPHQLPAQVGDTTNLLLKKLVTATQDLGGSGGVFLTEAEADALYFRLNGSNSPLTKVSATEVDVPADFILRGAGNMGIIPAAASGLGIGVQGTTGQKIKLYGLSVATTPVDSTWWTSAAPGIFGAYTEGAGAGAADWIYAHASDSNNAAVNIIGRKSRGTLAAPAIVANGDQSYQFIGSYYDGAAFRNTAGINFVIDGTPGAGAVPSLIAFSTGETTGRVQRVAIKANGALRTGITSSTTAFWGLNGIVQGTTASATFTDSTSSGNVSTTTTFSSYAVPSLNSSSAANYDLLANVAILGDPTVTGNATLSATGISYGLVNLGKHRASGVIHFPATNTLGAQWYNTTDQVTTTQFLEAKYASSVAVIGTRTTGTIAGTPLSLFSQSSNAASDYSRLDIYRVSAPFFRQGIYSTQTGTGLATSTANGNWTQIGEGISSVTSGSVVRFAILPTYNQASGTAANTDLLINRTETAVGSGVQYLIQTQVGSSNRAVLTTTGSWLLNGSIQTGDASSSPGARLHIRSNTFNLAAWTTNGAVVRVDSGTVTDTSTAGSGTAPTAAFTSFAQPTLAATNTLVTTTDAATVYIANAPASGTNNTITSPHALWVDAGNVRLDSTLQVCTTVATPASGSNSCRWTLGSALVSFYIGTGNPTVSAPKGSIYTRTDATTTTTRLWVNTDGGTTWAFLTTSA